MSTNDVFSHVSGIMRFSAKQHRTTGNRPDAATALFASAEAIPG